MKRKALSCLVAFALLLGGVFFCPSLRAEDHGDTSFYRPLTLAAATLESSGGGAAAEEADPQAELAKKLQNPVADLISVPIQNNWDFGIGPADAMKYTANIQPVIPFSISEDWNVITRTIVPVIYEEALDHNPLAPAKARQSHYGL